MPSERPAYRPFALLAFIAAVIVGVPLGVHALAALHVGAPAVPIPWLLLHAHVQIVAFYATLIVGVAPHLLAWFTGRPLATPAWQPIAVVLLASGLALRVIDAAAGWAPGAALGAALQAVVLVAFAAYVWRALDPPPLAPLRHHLTVSSAWIALALVLESALRSHGVWSGTGAPAIGTLRALHAVALLGGVLGWVLGVLLRAGPMFVPGWSPPRALATALPWALGTAAVVAAGGETAIPAAPAMVRLGEALALGMIVIVMGTAGALGRAPAVLPLLSRSAPESRIFRIALVSAVAGAIGGVIALVMAAAGVSAPGLGDAVRHLLTVGVLGAVVVAMSFRLVVVLEGQPLPWPRLRDVAFVLLAASVVLRTFQILVPHGMAPLAPLVALSGVLAWAAFASVAVTLVAVAIAPRTPSAS